MEVLRDLPRQGLVQLSPLVVGLVICPKLFEGGSGAVALGQEGGAQMPTYEYRCTKCGEKFERSEHLAEHGQVQPRCPKCGSEEVQPVLGAFFAKTSKKS